jgi:putative methyltransferase
MNVLFSNPSLDEEKVWLPYTWGRLREYCEYRSPHDLSAVNWLDPIYLGYWNDITEVSREYDLSKVDILLLSMYVWNVDRNIQIAEMTKAANPNVIILAGGPHACHKPHQLDEIARYKGLVDWVTPNEGEEPLANFLHATLNNLPIDENVWADPKNPRILPPIERLELKGVQHSPYKLYIKDYRRFAIRLKKKYGWINALYEGNRGCPYKCSYCDWGSLTASKIKIYPKEVTRHDFDVFSELQVNFVFSADANFGIFKEDLDDIRYLIKLNKETGWPATASFCSNKNKKEISNLASVELFESGMNVGYQLAFQHTDKDVLSAIDRDNIKDEKLDEELKLMYDNNMPLVAAAIIGMPNDTLNKWKNNLEYLLTSGFHEDIRVHDFMLLPNAPAADPEYITKYGIKTQTLGDSYVYKGLSNGDIFYAKFITETNTFNIDDYVEMQTLTMFLLGMHHLNITRFIAMYCNQYHGISYIKFYDELIKIHPFNKIYNDLRSNIKKWATNKNSLKLIEFDGELVPPDLWAKFSLVNNISNKNIFDLVYLVQQLTGLDEEKCIDMVKAQLLSIVSWKKPYSFKLKYNFPEIFSKMYFNNPKNISSEYPIRRTKTRIATITDFTINYQKPNDLSVLIGKSSVKFLEAVKIYAANRRHGNSHYHQLFNL